MADVNATPNIAPATRLSSIAPKIKAARPDIIVDDPSLPIDTILQLFVEDLGAQELLNMSRHDLINGQRSEYSLLANTDRLNQKFNPLTIFSNDSTLPETFKNYSINFDIHVPINGTGELISENSSEREKVYVDTITGNLIIDVINMNINERVEIELLNSGEIISDTIVVEES